MASMRGAKTVREAIPVADYHMRSEDETEDAMDESKNSMDESQATESDGSDEEVEPSVQEDINRFEQSFKNISTRFRLINRIGEGEFLPNLKSITSLTRYQAPSRPSTKPKISSTTSSRTTGTKSPSHQKQKHLETGHEPGMSPSRKSTSHHRLCASSTNSNCCTTCETRRMSVHSSPRSATKIKS